MWPSWPRPRTASSTPGSRPLWSQPWTVCGTPAYVLPSSWSYPPVDVRKGKDEVFKILFLTCIFFICSIFTCMFLTSINVFLVTLMHRCIEAVRNANVTLQCLSLRDSGDNELGNRPLMGEVNSHNSRDILLHWLNIYNIVSLPYSQSPPLLLPRRWESWLLQLWSFCLEQIFPIMTVRTTPL